MHGTAGFVNERIRKKKTVSFVDFRQTSGEPHVFSSPTMPNLPRSPPGGQIEQSGVRNEGPEVSAEKLVELAGRKPDDSGDDGELLDRHGRDEVKNKKGLEFLHAKRSSLIYFHGVQHGAPGV